MCECKINDFYSLRLIENKMHIYFYNGRHLSIPFEDIEHLVIFDDIFITLTYWFRSCCWQFATWSFFKYRDKFIKDEDKLLREIARNGDIYAKEEFITRFRTKLIRNFNNEYVMRILLKDENLQIFNDDDLIELIRLLNSHVKLFNKSIRGKGMLLRLIPILEQQTEVKLAKKLLWKLLNKDTTLILNNDYIWDFVTQKDPVKFRTFIIDAYGVLLKRREDRRADILGKILDST